MKSHWRGAGASIQSAHKVPEPLHGIWFFGLNISNFKMKKAQTLVKDGEKTDWGRFKSVKHKHVVWCLNLCSPDDAKMAVWLDSVCYFYLVLLKSVGLHCTIITSIWKRIRMQEDLLYCIFSSHVWILKALLSNIPSSCPNIFRNFSHILIQGCTSLTLFFFFFPHWDSNYLNRAFLQVPYQNTICRDDNWTVLKY